MIMIIPLLIGVFLLIIAVYIGFKLVKSIILGIVLIILFLLGCFLVFGSIPNLKDLPIIGSILKSPHEINVLDVSIDAQNNLLIAVQNTGVFDVSGFNIVIDNNTVNITNKPTDPLKAGDVTIIQTDWNRVFEELSVRTNQTETIYSGVVAV